MACAEVSSCVLVCFQVRTTEEQLEQQQEVNQGIQDKLRKQVRFGALILQQKTMPPCHQLPRRHLKSTSGTRAEIDVKPWTHGLPCPQIEKLEANVVDLTQQLAMKSRVGCAWWMPLGGTSPGVGRMAGRVFRSHLGIWRLQPLPLSRCVHTACLRHPQELMSSQEMVESLKAAQTEGHAKLARWASLLCSACLHHPTN